MVFKFELGQRLKCMVTGLTGICIGRNQWLNGCVQYCIKPPMKKDGTVPDGTWVDEQQIEQSGKGLKITQSPTGGPNYDAPKA